MSVNDHSYIIIGGSTKCATTSLFKYLADHPQVSGSKIKESRFFWKGSYNLKKESVNFSDGLDKFDTLFEDKDSAVCRLEATPDYLYSKLSASLIKESLNNVRLVFIVRDPINRVVSWYKFSKQLNLISETKSIDDFILEQFNLDISENRSQHLHAVEQGKYGKYLNSYIDLFGRDKIKVISYERLTNSPVEVLSDICSYIGIDPDFFLEYDFKIMNQSVNVADAKSYNKYRDFRRKIRRTFKSIIPEKFRNPFRKIFKKVDGIYMNTTTSDFEEIIISEEVRNKLLNFYAEDKLVIHSIINN